MKDETPHPHSGRSRLVLGIFLLALGALMLAVNLGYALPEGWWRYFPVPLIAFGLWGLILPSRHLDRSGGVWLLATGIYCLIGIFGLFGLGWGSAWPIFVIAAGLSFIVGRSHPGHPGQSDPGQSDPRQYDPRQYDHGARMHDPAVRREDQRGERNSSREDSGSHGA